MAKLKHMYANVTRQEVADELKDSGARIIEVVNNNIKNVDTLNRLDQRRDRKALDLVLAARFNELQSEKTQLDIEIAATVLNADRLSRRLLLVERRVRELEARTLTARWRALRSWCRAFVAELGGPFVYDEEPAGRPRRVWQFLGGRWNEMHLADEPLDPALTDELIEMYRPPSLPLVRQDARHAPQ